MPICYTCHEEITFDREIKSASGKPIPLFPDKKNTHSHDEEGKPIRRPLPSQPLSYPQQQQEQQQRPPPSSTYSPYVPTNAPSASNQSLDQKRIRVMLEEQTQQLMRIEQKIEHLESLTLIDTPKLIGQIQTIFDLGVATGKLPPTETADKLYQKEQQQKDSALVNHSEKADKFQQAMQDRRKNLNDTGNFPDSHLEFERMKKFTSVEENDTYEDNTTGGGDSSSDDFPSSAVITTTED